MNSQALSIPLLEGLWEVQIKGEVIGNKLVELVILGLIKRLK